MIILQGAKKAPEGRIISALSKHAMRQCIGIGIVKCEGIDQCRSSFFLYIKRIKNSFIQTKLPIKFGQNEHCIVLYGIIGHWSPMDVRMFLCNSCFIPYMILESQVQGFHCFAGCGCDVSPCLVQEASDHWPGRTPGQPPPMTELHCHALTNQGTEIKVKEAGTGSIEAHAQRSACTKSAQKTNYFSL